MIKITYFLSHPIQYQIPLIEKVSYLDILDLNVVYLSNHTVKPYFDEGLNRIIKFDNINLSQHAHQFIFENRKINKLLFIIKFILLVKKNKERIFWFHGFSDFYNLVGIFICILFKNKIILRGESNNLKKKSFKQFFLTKIFFKLIDPFILNYLSIGKLNKIFYQNLIDPKKIKELPYVVGNLHNYNLNLQKKYMKKTLKIDDKCKIIMFNAKLIERKNPEILIKAFLKIKYQYHGLLKLIIIGDGILKNKLKKKYYYFKDILFLGFINQSKLCNFYQIADIFILPSKYDSWGLVVNEAMQFEVPVITSQYVGSSYDLITGQRYLQTFNSQHDLEKKIIFLLKNKKKLSDIKIKTKFKIKNYDLNCAKNKLNDYLSSLSE